MDVLDKFFTKYSYKFPKGYPDLKDKQDILLMESILEELNIEIDLKEATLSGRTTNYPQSTGAFYKYIELNPNSSELEFETDRDAILFDKETLNPVANISKGEKFKILDKKESDLTKKGSAYITNINYEGEEFLIKLSDILKPTGKKVEYIEVNTDDKLNPDVYVPFKGGHGHEAEITKLFGKGSNENWEFEYNGKTYKIEKLGSPANKLQGNPKTDLFVKLDKPIPPYGDELKISLKAANATFVENHMLPSRFKQIIGEEEGKDIIIDFVNKINKGEIKVRVPFMRWFIKTPPYNSISLDKEQKYESFSGANKFGEDDESTANCYFKGEVPNTIAELISELKPINTLDSDIGLHIRGYGSAGNPSLYIKEEDNWVISDLWKEEFEIEETTDELGNIKYT